MEHDDTLRPTPYGSLVVSSHRTAGHGPPFTPAMRSQSRERNLRGPSSWLRFSSEDFTLEPLMVTRCPSQRSIAEELLYGAQDRRRELSYADSTSSGEFWNVNGTE